MTLRAARCALPLLAALCGQPALAQGHDRASAFVALVQANGCAITEAQAQTLLPPAGLTMDDAQDAAALMSRGRLFRIDDDGATLRLVPELCAADAGGVAALLAAAAQAPEPGVWIETLAARVDPDAAAGFVQVLRQNACAMTEDQAQATLPALGYAQEQVQDFAAVLLNTGMAGFDGDALRLSDAACASDAVTDAAWIAVTLARDALLDGTAAAPDDPATLRAVLMMWAVGEGCALDPARTDAAADLALGFFDTTGQPHADRAALAARLATLAADPGPAFRPDPDRPGHLRLAYCPS